MASRVCRNAACAGNGTVVDTDSANCIMCQRPLRSVFGGPFGSDPFDVRSSAPPEPIDEALREAVNVALHRSVNVADACVTACTHLIHGEWTALGLANVVARHAKP